MGVISKLAKEMKETEARCWYVAVYQLTEQRTSFFPPQSVKHRKSQLISMVSVSVSQPISEVLDDILC